MQKHTKASMILDYSDLVKYEYNKTGKKDFSDKEMFQFSDQLSWWNSAKLF